MPPSLTPEMLAQLAAALPTLLAMAQATQPVLPQPMASTPAARATVDSPAKPGAKNATAGLKPGDEGYRQPVTSTPIGTVDSSATRATADSVRARAAAIDARRALAVGQDAAAVEVVSEIEAEEEEEGWEPGESLFT